MSLVELTVAMGLLLLLVSSLFSAFKPADGMFALQTETADMQQRVRAAIDALSRDVSLAGAGAGIGPGAAPLATLVPPVLPRRIGLRGPDAPDVFRTDAISVITALPLPSVVTRLVDPLSASNTTARVESDSGCARVDPQCGIAVDDDVVVADDDGGFDFYTVTGATPPYVSFRYNGTDWPGIHPAGSRIAKVAMRTYFIRPAGGTRPPQLMRYEGGSGNDTPVVDHVAGLSFEYLGDPAPPQMRRPLSDEYGPWTTYGPPPGADTTVTPPTPRSSCLFVGTGAALASPRLPFLAAQGSALVPLTASQLTDGPWCPDDASPNRYDADLLRIRAVVVSLRVESALDALRGPASVLFARGGTARAGARFLPDLEVRWRMTPVNLLTGR